MTKNVTEIRSQEIVQALYRAIEKNGISLPGFDQIAASGNMSRQLVRHYFANSEEIALLLCDALAAAYKDCLLRGILLAEDGMRLTVFLDFYFNFLSEEGVPKPTDDVVYDAMFALAASNSKIRQSLHDQYSLLQMTLAHEIQISYPVLPQNICKELGYLIVIVMYGHWKMVASLGFSTEYNNVARESLDRLIHSHLAGQKSQEQIKN